MSYQKVARITDIPGLDALQTQYLAKIDAIKAKGLPLAEKLDEIKQRGTDLHDRYWGEVADLCEKAGVLPKGFLINQTHRMSLQSGNVLIEAKSDARPELPSGLEDLLQQIGEMTGATGGSLALHMPPGGMKGKKKGLSLVKEPVDC